MILKQHAMPYPQPNYCLGKGGPHPPCYTGHSTPSVSPAGTWVPGLGLGLGLELGLGRGVGLGLGLGLGWVLGSGLGLRIALGCKVDKISFVRLWHPWTPEAGTFDD